MKNMVEEAEVLGDERTINTQEVMDLSRASRICALSQNSIGWISWNQMDKREDANGDAEENRYHLQESLD